MRKLTMAALAGAIVAGGALAGCASDPYYDSYASRDPYYDRYYYGPAYAPGYAHNDTTVALSVLGSLIGSDYNRVPVDRYGPNPHGMIGPDGHRITCRLRTSYDSVYGGRITRRVCR